MRIISEHKDFYDCVQAHGQDQSFIYLRKPATWEYDRKPITQQKNPSGNLWPFPTIRASTGRMLYIREHIIGFCGKIYPALHLRKEIGSTPTICFEIGDVDRFVESNYKKEQVEEYFTPKKRSYWSSKWHAPDHKKFSKFFEKCVDQKDQHENIFVESGHPIFVATYRDRYWYDITKTPVWSPSSITFNANLKEHEFYKIFPTALAYQEISMYLGGVLGQGNPPVPEVSNNDLIEAKGFDLKTSFRKEKEKK